MIKTSSRRIATAVTALVGTAALLAGCGNGAVDSTEDAGADPVASSEDFSVTVDTVYGEITLDEKPQRIVAIVGPYLDMLLALDEAPVAFAGAGRSDGDFLEGYPWLEDQGLDLSTEDPGLLAEGYTPSLEAIAAYEPDLILAEGSDWAVDEALYQEISQIAPTYTSPHDHGGWADTLTDIAALTGKSDMAAEIISDVDAEFAEARDRLPGIAGGTYVVADRKGQEFVLRTNRFLFEELGLEPDTELAALKSVSVENIDQITADVLEVMAWKEPATRSDLEADPRFEELPASQNGTVIFSDEALTTAVDAGPASIKWWLDQVVPQLEDSALNTENR